jgi:hypothetical protein
MKICIPTHDERGLQSEVFGHFGSAPFFTLVDSESGEVVLQDGSAIHTAGEIPILYGTLEDLVWRMPDKSGAPGALGPEVVDLPDKSVEITAHSVVLQEGSEVDVSGGGLLFSYLFQPGLEGTNNPLTKQGRHVIMPGNAPLLPGDGVYLEEGPATGAGLYSLLPDWCAFLPGALVLTDLVEAGEGYTPGQLFSEAGYPVVQGYETVLGTSVRSPLPTGFSVRPASEALTEGYFTVAEAKAGAAGHVSIQGQEIVLDGAIRMEALPLYRGGTIGLGGKKIAIGRPTDGFTPDMVVDPSFFSHMDLEEIRIGDKDLEDMMRTDEIRMYLGTLEAPNIVLSANGDITLMPGAEIHATDECVRMDHLIYRYEFEPGLGLGVVHLRGMGPPIETGLWQAEAGLKGTGGVAALEIVGDGQSILNVLYEGKLEIPVGIDLPFFGATGTAGGFGKAGLVSESDTITLKSGAFVHTSHEVSLDGRIDFEEGAVLQSDHSTISLSGSTIFFVPTDYTAGMDGLYLTDNMWRCLSSFEDITLKSRSDVIFLGDHLLAAPGKLAIDAARLAGSDGDETVGIFAPELSLLNTGAQSTKPGALQDDAGELSLGGDRVEIGLEWPQGGASNRNMTFDGFSAINVSSGQDVVFKGKGTVDTGQDADTSGGELKVSAARVTTALYRSEGEDGGVDYGTTDIRLDAGDRTIVIEGNGESPGTDGAAGGRLEVSGRIIRLGREGEVNAALIDMPSGMVLLDAGGSIHLGKGAGIVVKGTEFAPGGVLEARAQQGALSLEQGSFIDISAGAQGDAGVLSLSAPLGGVRLEGTLLGHSAGGRGGSFEMETDRIDDFSSLNNLLSAGGFTQSIDLRARTGNVTISPGERVATRQFKLAVDQGNLSVYGEIDASGLDGGGSVELYAGNLLYLYPEARIYAKGLGESAAGGEVFLGTSSGYVATLSNSLMDVSGGEGDMGGTVSIRAPRHESADLNEVFLLPFGTITGADDVLVEAFKAYSFTGNKTITSADFGSSKASGWWKETDLYMNSASSIESRLLSTVVRVGWSEDQLHLVPGIELRSTENLTLSSDWDLKGWRFGGKPAVLTLRAAGNLDVNADLTDARTSQRYLYTNVQGPDTCGFNLIAGADLQSADTLAIRTGEGDLRIAGQKVVYTENGDIRFVAGNDVILLQGRQTGFMINPEVLKSMTYNIGTYRGSIYGVVGRDLKIGGSSGLSYDGSGGIQTALGNIDLEVGRDLLLKYTSYSKSVGIRTTGGVEGLIWQEDWKDHPELWPEGFEDLVAEAASLFVPPPWPPERKRQRRQDYLDNNIHSYYHRYARGGDITVRVGRNLLAQGTEAFGTQAWDYAYQGGHWAASYEHVTSGVWLSAPVGGLATMGGGDLSVRTGGNFESKAGTFGKGDLSVFANGDLDGKFLVKEGEGLLRTLGSFGLDHDVKRTIELFDGRIAVFAQGNAVIGETVNPTTREGSIFDKRGPFGEQLIDLRYAEDASLAVTALMGSITLPTGGLFPAVLDIEAGGDIDVEHRLVLAPSRSGGLRLVAGGNIYGAYGGGNLHGEIIMSDISPEAAYAFYPWPSFEYAYPDGHAKAGETEIITYKPTRALIESRYLHGFPSETPREKPGNQDYFRIYRGMADGDMSLIPDEEDRAFLQGISSLLYDPVHLGESTPIEIRAGGDIRDITFSLSKETRISAGGSIRNIHYFGQNNNRTDISIIQAKGNIIFQEEPFDASYRVGIEQAGPGFLAVQAGNTIDLGETRGIKSIGDMFNGYLGAEGSSLIVMSGLHGDLEEETVVQDVDDLFGELRRAGMEFSKLMAEGKAETARRAIDQTREEVIGPFLEGYAPGKGDINMITSQIGSDAKNTDIYILARGEINVGKSTFFADEADRRTTGLYTALGGGVNIFSRADVNVNESRIMTYMGGDITVWSEEGNINAGKGSKTAINVEPPQLTWVGGLPVIKFIPPAVGSGIRCLTYDPDGYEGPRKQPPPGDIYLTAPQGVIDAGEAGISGGSVFLGATEVLNAQNISFSGTALGVPAASASPTGIGALSGVGSLTEMSKMTEQASSLASDRAEAAQQAAKMMETFVPKWVDVEVIGFE